MEFFFLRNSDSTLGRVVYIVILVPGRARQEDFKFEANLGYIVKSSLAWATQQDPISKGKRNLTYIFAPSC